MKANSSITWPQMPNAVIISSPQKKMKSDHYKEKDPSQLCQNFKIGQCLLAEDCRDFHGTVPNLLAPTNTGNLISKNYPENGPLSPVNSVVGSKQPDSSTFHQHSRIETLLRELLHTPTDSNFSVIRSLLESSGGRSEKSLQHIACRLLESSRLAPSTSCLRGGQACKLKTHVVEDLTQFDPAIVRTLGALGVPALSTGEPHLVEPFMKHLAAGLSIPPSELFSTKKDVEEYAALAAFTRASNGDLSSVRSLAVGIAYAILQAHLFNPAPAQRLQCSSFHNASQNTDQEGSNKHKQTLFDLDLYLTPVQATALFERLSSLLSRHSLDAELEAAFYDIIGPAVSVETQIEKLEPLLASADATVKGIAKAVLQQLLCRGPRASETLLAKLLVTSEPEYALCLMSALDGIRFWQLPADVCQALFGGLFPLLSSISSPSCVWAMAGCAVRLEKLSQLEECQEAGCLSEGHLQFLLQHALKLGFAAPFLLDKNPYLKSVRLLCLGVPKMAVLAFSPLAEKVKELSNPEEVKNVISLLVELSWHAHINQATTILQLLEVSSVRQLKSCMRMLLVAYLRLSTGHGQEKSAVHVQETVNSKLCSLGFNAWDKYLIGIESAICCFYSIAALLFDDAGSTAWSESTAGWCWALKALCTAEGNLLPSAQSCSEHEQGPASAAGNGGPANLTLAIDHILGAQGYLRLCCPSGEKNGIFEFSWKWVDLRLQSLLLLRQLQALCRDFGTAEWRPSSKTLGSRKEERMKRFPSAIRYLASQYNTLLCSTFGSDPQTHATLVSVLVMWKLLYLVMKVLMSDTDEKAKAKNTKGRGYMKQQLLKWNIVNVPGQNLRQVCVYVLSTVKDELQQDETDSSFGFITLGIIVNVLAAVPWNIPRRLFCSLPLLRTQIEVVDEHHRQVCCADSNLCLSIPSSDRRSERSFQIGVTIYNLLQSRSSPNNCQDQVYKVILDPRLKKHHNKTISPQCLVLYPSKLHGTLNALHFSTNMVLCARSKATKQDDTMGSSCDTNQMLARMPILMVDDWTEISIVCEDKHGHIWKIGSLKIIKNEC